MATEMFWVFFNSERLSSHSMKSLPQLNGENCDFGSKIIIFVKNRKK